MIDLHRGRLGCWLGDSLAYFAPAGPGRTLRTWEKCFYIMMQTVKIIAISLASICIATAAEVTLKDSTPFPIYIDGKMSGTITAPKGAKVTVLSADNETIRVRYQGSESSVSIGETDYKEIISRHEEAARNRESEKQEAKKQKENLERTEKATEAQQAYAAAKIGIERMRSSLDRFIGPDREFALLIIKDGEELVEAFEKGTDSDKEAAYKNHQERWRLIYDTKPVFGYKHNEFLKHEVETPIIFNLFSDSNEFYIQVGDGDFCTVAPIPVDDLIRLSEQFDRINQWAKQTLDGHMDVRKDIGRFGGVSLEFIAKESGETVYLLLTAHGTFQKDRMLEEQTVRVNLLNWNCLQYRIAKAQEIYEKREERKRNADKLK